MYRVTRYAPRARTAILKEMMSIQAEADSRLEIIKVEPYVEVAVRDRNRDRSWKSEVVDSRDGSFGRDRVLNLIPVMIHMCT
jgi:hypothetical protein